MADAFYGSKAAGKKPARTYQCNFKALHEDCKKHIAFLLGALNDKHLTDDVHLQNAVIHSVIMLGENLTFARDDENFSKTLSGQEKQIIKNFVYFRNQLLHNTLYCADPIADMRQVFTEALRGRFSTGYGIIALRGLIDSMPRRATAICEELGQPIDAFALAKSVGVKPGFNYNPKEWFRAARIAFDILKKTKPNTPEGKAALLHCLQILDDAATLNDKCLDAHDPPIFKDATLAEFALILKMSTENRKILAHPLSYRAAEVNQADLFPSSATEKTK